MPQSTLHALHRAVCAVCSGLLWHEPSQTALHTAVQLSLALLCALKLDVSQSFPQVFCFSTVSLNTLGALHCTVFWLYSVFSVEHVTCTVYLLHSLQSTSSSLLQLPPHHLHRKSVSS